LPTRIRLVRIGDEPKRVRNIEFPACLVSSRRENFACVADAHSYALLDVENQQKISLFPISSLDDNEGGGKVEDISSVAEPRPARHSNATRPTFETGGEVKGHGRSKSLGTFVGGLGRRQESPQPRSRDRSALATPELTPRTPSPSAAPVHSRSGSSSASPNRRPAGPEKPLANLPERTSSLKKLPPLPPHYSENLKPHICSPSGSEFLLTTGTTPLEPGVGIFVNLDGDVVRGTLEFSSYPTSLAIDISGSDIGGPERDHESYVLASVTRTKDTENSSAVEIQSLNSETNEPKTWLEVSSYYATETDASTDVFDDLGVRAVHTAIEVPFPEVGASLRAKQLRFRKEHPEDPTSDSNSLGTIPDLKLSRDLEEDSFARRLGGRTSRIVVWSGSSIWWMTRNPVVMRLDVAIDQALGISQSDPEEAKVDRNKMIYIINTIRGQEATTETDFLSFGYIRQKISLILFCDLLVQTSANLDVDNVDKRITEGLLMEGGLDPRVVISMVPLLREEIIEGAKGIWVHAGLLAVVERYWSVTSSQLSLEEKTNPKSIDMMVLIKRYLISWRQRKGFGSIADEVEVFQTVDAAMLHLMLHHDSLLGETSLVSSRVELYSFVDAGVDCFERAVLLLERYQRLYVLSRLYQSRKLTAMVLQTWKRIIDGEKDSEDEFIDGENEFRKYLIKIRDPALVQEFGSWLARRNPLLGVQVFMDDNRRVKLEPHSVVRLLQANAPDAVKVYLEHLVFGKKNFQYANDLISYYLDSVLSVLGSSAEARQILSESYETYRALDPPKPTYRQFIIDNAIPLPWWHDRLRLLELLGGSHGTDFSYDVGKVLSRIEPHEQDLVPESIILDGRQGRHEQALRLLTHGLGDFHTAINYCLLGGASIFHPMSGHSASFTAPSREEQKVLFQTLLGEFLQIHDMMNRLERTSELLERFGSWYDVSEVLALIPLDWSVELISGFLIGAFRRLVEEKNEAMITKALSGAENLQIASTLIEKCKELGPQIEGAQ
jgi:vacuolar protein sorting-associated protein 3